MSKFSGKCDFYDGFVAIACDGDEEKLNEKIKRLKLYVQGSDGREHLVKSDTIKDIVKYYPYLKVMSYGNNKDGKYVVVLSSDSFIDQEEAEFLEWRIRDCLKYWRKCKRNKVDFDVTEFLNSCYISRHGDDAMVEIAKRVKEHGDKATFDGIHLPMHEHFRKEWFKELVSLGYTEYEAFRWVYKAFFFSEEEMKKRLETEL